jgi:uncharacterized protein
MESLLLKIVRQPLPWFCATLISALLVILTGCSSSLIYYPDKDIRATPANVDLSYESVYIQTKDKVKLSGWWIPATNAQGTVLFFHGNGGNISYYLDILPVFNKLGFATLLIDYRGYGMSEGRPTEKGTYNDAEAAWNYLIHEKKIPPNRIIIMGRSLGGAVAAWIASCTTPGLVILESSFLSFAKVAKDLYPWVPAKLLFGNIYNTEAAIDLIRCPVLIIHSQDDEIVPFDHGLKLFELAREPKEFLKISGSHNSGFYQSLNTYTSGIASFIARHLNRDHIKP